MTCSKIFSGDIPELTNKILQYFRDDPSTLHSCILVNRSWCRLAIPLLWEDPFSIPTKNYKNYHFIEIYLHDLNEDDKTKLNEYGINENLFPSNTLFNYPIFIQYLDAWRIIQYIREWIRTSTTISHQCLRFIYKALLKSFIENDACLHTLIIRGSFNDNFLNDFFELILQNPNFIHNINKLKYGITNINVDVSRFMTLLSSNCNLISTLDIYPSFTFKNYSSQIIKSQQNLKKVTVFSRYSLHHSLLLSLKNSNCSNTLKTIIFSRVDFQNIVILSEVFEQLNVLESVHLLNCLSLDFHFVQQIIKITKPFKLKSLIMRGETFQVELFQLLLQKSGNYLENIGLPLQTSQSEHQLFEIITKYCTNIKFLDLSVWFKPNIYLTFDLIKNIGQNLNYLSIDGHRNGVSSIISQELGQILPHKLEYLHLTLSINTSDFEAFLKNSQNTFINTLLIHRKCVTVDGGVGILPFIAIIEKYIMKKKRVKYLAFKVTEYFKGVGSEWDLFNSKGIVKNFKLYNIEVKGYFDLCIDYSQHKKNSIFHEIFQ